MQIEPTAPHRQRSTRTLRGAGSVFALAMIAVLSAMAQKVSTAPVSATAAALPAAPEPQLESGGVAGLPEDPGQRQLAPIHAKYIFPGVSAQPRAGDKVAIGLKDSYRLTNFGGMFAAAGYEQLRNHRPNYGTDRGAFGERLGAAAIRDTAQGVLTDAVYAPLLHEDPRYYVEGPQYGFLHRAWYALTRPLITRTDSGHKTINGALLLGYASASAISDAYYPQVNRNARDTAEGFAGSLGGSALGFTLSEFTYSFWHDLHLGPKE